MEVKEEFYETYFEPFSKDEPLTLDMDILGNLRQGFSARDRLITELLTDYVQQRRDREILNGKLKGILFWVFVGTFVLVTLGMIALSYRILLNPITASVVVSLLSVCVSYIGSIVAVINLMGQYLFPVDEEKNFTEMVKIIVEKDVQQQRDLM